MFLAAFILFYFTCADGLSTAALLFRFYSHRIQPWSIKAASYIARWILRSHMQYSIEIGSSCNFQVSQGSVETHLRWDGESLGLWCVCTKFLRNLTVKEFCKSVYIRRSYNQKSIIVLFFFDSQYRPLWLNRSVHLIHFTLLGTTLKQAALIPPILSCFCLYYSVLPFNVNKVVQCPLYSGRFQRLRYIYVTNGTL